MATNARGLLGSDLMDEKTENDCIMTLNALSIISMITKISQMPSVMYILIHLKCISPMNLVCVDKA